YIDAADRLRLDVYRTKIDITGTKSLTNEQKVYLGARAGDTYFKDWFLASEPRLTMALREGETGGVVFADLSLTDAEDAISKVGLQGAGQAYVVDGDGYLIIYRDPTRTLRKVRLTAYPQVRAALQPASSRGGSERQTTTGP